MAKFNENVVSTGTVTGSNLSGTNTGDQDLSGLAPLASPAFTGTPTAPTAAAGTNTTQLATTAFVAAANTASSTKLKTPRTVALGGLLSGSALFDGTGDVVITATMADAALSIAKTSGLQAALDGKVPTGGAFADYAGSDPLYYNGTGSVVDCNTLVAGTRALVTVGGSNTNYPPAGGGTTNWYIETVRPYSSLTRVQRAYAYNGTAKMAQRSSIDGTTWSAWVIFNPATKADLSGAAFTGAISAPNLTGTNTGDQDLSGLAPKNSPTFTGTVNVPYLIAGDGNGTASIRVGNDTDLWDVNVANTFGVKGAQDPTKGFIRFGSDTNGLGWDGSKLAYGAATVWHSGNFDPSTKANANNAAFTGTMTLPTGAGTCTIAPGTGDGASYTTYNFKISSWWGIGFATYDGSINGFYDARAGRWDTKGGYRVNGQDVWYPGNFNPAAKADLVNPTFPNSLTVDCTNATDGLAVNKPGSSPAGSFVNVSSPGGSPGIIAQFGTTKRRDIQFTNTGIQFAVSASTAGSGVQFTFAENGGFTATGPISASNITSTVIGNNIVQRNASGYILANYINTTANDVGAAVATDVAVQTGNDSYLRWQTPANFITSQGIAKLSGAAFTGAITCTSTITATNHINSSDRTLKRGIAHKVANPRLADLLQLCTWLWRADGARGDGLIAQDVRRFAPEYVCADPATGLLSIDKAGIALEAVIGLAARVRELERERGRPGLLRRLWRAAW